MAKKINIKGVADWKCPVCGDNNNIVFWGGDGGDEQKTKDGNTILSYSCKCNNCGTILQSSYLFIGNLTIDQFNDLAKYPISEDCYNEQEHKRIEEKRKN